MNYHLNHIPERTVQPRTNGLTMVMDKGYSLREAENMIERNGKISPCFLKLDRKKRESSSARQSGFA